MARQAITILGTVVGAYFGNPQLGYAIGAMVGGAVDPEIIKGPKIGDMPVQTSRDGVPRPIVYGTGPCVGNIVDRGQTRISTERERQGKGGPVVESERAHITFAIRICEGPVTGISRIWENEKLVYDVRATGNFLRDSNNYYQKVRIYLGGESQLPDPALEAMHGVGSTPAYRGSCYIVFPNYDITDTRSIPQFRFEVNSNSTSQANDGLPYRWWLTARAASAATSPGSVDQRLWSSEDLLTWVPATTPLGVNKTYSAGVSLQLEFCGAASLIHANTSGNEIIENLSPTDPADNPITSIARAGPVEKFIKRDIQRTLQPTVVAYCQDWVTLDGGLTLQPIIQPDIATLSGGSIYAITRTGMKRWLAWGGGITGYEFLYSDLNIPGPWTNAGRLPGIGFGNPNVENWSIDSSFSETICIGDPGNVYTSGPNGLSFSHTATLSGINNGKHIKHGGGDWIIGTYGVNNASLFRRAADNSWTEVEKGISNGGILAGEIIQLYYSDGTWVCVTTSTPFIYVSLDQGTAWQAGALPSGLGGGGFDAGFPLVTFLGNAGPAVNPEIITPGSVPLSYIVTDISDRMGVGFSKIDVTELVDYVDGFVISGDFTAADCIRSLQRVYFFDESEYDKVLHFVKRGANSVLTLTEDDMLEAPEELKREQELEFPRKFHLVYASAARGYAQSKQTSYRNSPDIKVVGEASFEVPVTMTDNLAAQVGDKLHKISWVEQGGELKFSIPDKYAYLTATDVVTLSYRNKTRRTRIERIESADGVMSITSRMDRQSAYSSDAVGASPRDPLDPISTIPGETLFRFMNLPALIDADDRLGYYIIGAGVEPGWSGASIQRSIDGGATFEGIQRIGVGAIVGTLDAQLPGANAYALDSANVLKVTINGDGNALDSLSEIQLLNENNACAIVSALGVCEIIQFQDAVQNIDGSWELTNLIRGRLETIPAYHQAGEFFCLLDGSKFIESPSSLIGLSLIHRPVSYRTTPEDALEYIDTWSPARSQLEFAPYNLTLSRVGSNITASWIPKHRFGTTLNPIASANFQGYRITIVGSSTVTFDQLGTSFTYDAALLGSPVNVSVAGINRITGAGNSATGTI